MASTYSGAQPQSRAIEISPRLSFSPLRPERFVTKKIVATACRILSGSSEKLSLGDISIARDWGWAPEYVEAMWLMLQQKEAEDYVVATGETHTLEEFIAEAFDSVGLDWRDRVVLDPSLQRPTEIRIGKGNPAKASIKLGWKANYKMHDVIRMMVEDERKGA